MKTRLALFAAALFAAMALAPVAPASVADGVPQTSANTRSVFGTVCNGVFSPTPYYYNSRIFAQGSNVMGCGNAVGVDALLGATDTVTLSSVKVNLDYCVLLSIGGPIRIGGEVVGDALSTDTAGALVGASDIGCRNGGSYAIPGGANGGTCLTFTGSVLGDLVVDQPILLAGGALATICNSQVGAPLLGDFVTEVCVSATVTDMVTGIVHQEEDTDWFVNAGAGVADYSQWLLNPASNNVGGTSITNEPDLNGGAHDVVFGPQAQGSGSC